jgi:3-mercaptopyruvate sulfurtransferase SseA
MNFKKYVALLLALVMLVALSACSKDDVAEDENTMDLTVEDTTEDTTDVVAEKSLDEIVNSYFSEKPDHSYLIDQTEFVARVAAGDDIVVLDIRQADVYEVGHVQGAINLPWGTAISDSLAMIPQDKEVFIYCYSGQTAG